MSFNKQWTDTKNTISLVLHQTDESMGFLCHLDLLVRTIAMEEGWWDEEAHYKMDASRRIWDFLDVSTVTFDDFMQWMMVAIPNWDTSSNQRIAGAYSFWASHIFNQ